MQYDIAAKETVYKGITFRSRLEATWAAFFDLCGWRWEYECDPVRGWLPDFWIQASYSPGGILLAEVKPAMELPDDARQKIERAAPQNDCLILGLGPFQASDCIASSSIGWLTDNACFMDLPRDRREVQWEDPFWAEAVLDNDGGYGVMHSQGCYVNRMTGAYEGCMPSIDVPLETAQRMWGVAKRQVRYRPR